MAPLTIKCCIENNNFGDEVLNKFLAQQISKEEVRLIDIASYEPMAVLGGGSILTQAKSTDIVWGSGYISQDSKVEEVPQQICSVRGPLTRQLLLSQGIPCPEIYGDLGLLLPRFHRPNIEKKYELGVIPHYIDKDNKQVRRFQKAGCLIIDICSGLEKVVSDILSCKRIVSSTLHGIIVSDAYGVPAMWIEFSDKVSGNGFKFRDYFFSVHREDRIPLRITNKITLRDLHGMFYPYKIDIDLDKLYNACPYKPTTPKPIRIVFRNDDVGPNSNIEDLQRLYNHIKTKFPLANIISCIYLLDTIPTRNAEVAVRLDMSKMFDVTHLSKLYTIVSHGLMHFSHSRAEAYWQELSIILSTNLLKTKRFLPPFVESNLHTERVCKNHGIQLIGKEPWRSLDREDFDSSYPYWLFHSINKPIEYWINKINADKNVNKP